jgi:hypothetical protein
MFTNRPAMKRDYQLTQAKERSSKFSELEGDFYVIRDAVQKLILADNDNSQRL